MAEDSQKKDAEIEQVRREEQRGSGAVKRSAAQRQRHIEILAAKLETARQAKDERAYAELLRLANVREGSPEWTRAWEYYRS